MPLLAAELGALVGASYCLRVVVSGDMCRILVSIPRGVCRRVVVLQVLEKALRENGLAVCGYVVSVVYRHEERGVLAYGFSGDELVFCP